MVSLKLFYRATQELKKQYDGSQAYPYPSDVPDDEIEYFIKILKFTSFFDLQNFKLPFNKQPDKAEILFISEPNLTITILTR